MSQKYELHLIVEIDADNLVDALAVTSRLNNMASIRNIRVVAAARHDVFSAQEIGEALSRAAVAAKDPE